MRQISIDAWTTPDQLKVSEGPAPVCGADQIRIRVQATPVTYSLWLLIQGKYQRKPAFPFIPGTFAAGYVCEIGPDVTRFRTGDRVIASLEVGGLAEEVVIDEVSAYHIPDSLPFVHANALNSAYSSVMAALTWERSLHVQAGQTLLVTGAAGNVGTAAVEIGRILGATVIASASTPEKREFARRHGAHHVVEADVASLRDRVMEITGNEGVHAALDPVGGDTFREAMRCLRPEGRITPFGFASKEIPQIPANLLLVKNIAVSGIYMGYYKLKEKKRYEPLIRGMFTRLGEWYEQGLIHPELAAAFPLEQVGAAFEAVVARDRLGHVVVVQDEEARRLGFSS